MEKTMILLNPLWKSSFPTLCHMGLVVGFLTASTSQSLAHQGPPFPIIMDRMVGPYIVSVWADPNVGTGKFYIMLDPPKGTTLPEDTTVEVGVQPISKRLAEALYPASRQALQRVQYYVEIPFDAQERWRVRVALHSHRGGGEAVTEVEVTPPGPGPLSLVLYLFPFAAVGVLWIRGVLNSRSLPSASTPKMRKQKERD